MKTILCFGDSNLRGYIPGSFDEKTALSKRYAPHQRWTGVLQKILGESYHIIEEGLNGRTTVSEEIIPGRPYRNGLSLLPMCLESHFPIDLVIFLVGTNDTKIQFGHSAEEITEGMRQLVKMVKASDKNPQGKAPEILVIAPQPIINIPSFSSKIDLDDTSVKKSQALGKLYQQMATTETVKFLDASFIIKSSELDGVHFDESQHALLGQAVAEMVQNWR